MRGNGVTTPAPADLEPPKALGVGVRVRDRVKSGDGLVWAGVQG